MADGPSFVTGSADPTGPLGGAPNPLGTLASFCAFYDLARDLTGPQRLKLFLALPDWLQRELYRDALYRDLLEDAPERPA